MVRFNKRIWLAAILNFPSCFGELNMEQQNLLNGVFSGKIYDTIDTRSYDSRRYSPSGELRGYR